MVVAWAVSAAVVEPAAASSDLLGDIDAAFEVAGDGWSSSGGSAAVERAAPVHGGTGSARFTATGAGAVSFGSQYWRVATVGSAAHTLGVWVYDNDSRVSLTVELAFIDASGGVVGSPVQAAVGGDSASWRFISLGSTTSPGGAAYARITVRGTASALGATFSVDDVTLVRDDPPPATATPTPSATVAPTAAPTSTVSPVATAVPTPVVTAAVPRVYEALVNGGFDTAVALDGWQQSGGVASAVPPGLDGVGRAAMLMSESESTKWLTQTVVVEPGAWYGGRALLKLLGEASAGWLRVAWYASTDGEGTQIAVADSNLVTAIEAVTSVQLAAVQAPSVAHTARVRLMLRPAGGDFAALQADNVRFERTAAPAPTPVATPRVLPTPSTAPRASAPGIAAGAAATPATSGVPAPAAPPAGTRGAEQASAPRTIVPAQPTQRVSAEPPRAMSGALPVLRITEVYSDPPEPGNDADFEWIEIANLGAEAASLAGLLLADNQGTVELPALTLRPGGVIVVAGPQAKVPEAVAWWPPGGFSNGRGNAGDRLALFRADGQIIDALSYGSDTTYDRPALPAASAGRSLVRRFADDGSFQRAEVAAAPTPGVVSDREPGVERDASTVVEAAATRPFDIAGWGALATIGVGAMGAAAVQRYRVARAREVERGAR